MPGTETTREDFSQRTKELLAKRVGHCCSNPQCRQTTSGPQEDPAAAVNIGVACHITAASPGGPRYDPSLTSAQRCAVENGIWLCQTCGKLIDSDLKRYTATSLKEWKRLAEEKAARAIESGRSEAQRNESTFSKIEGLMPGILAEMRKDISQFPLCREFVVLQKNGSFGTRTAESSRITTKITRSSTTSCGFCRTCA